MGIAWVITGAIISWCAGQMGSSVGAALYEMFKRIADYIWLKPEEGYYKDYPEDPDNGKKDLKTVLKRLRVITQKNEK